MVNINTGKYGEIIASKLLIDMGYKIIEKNFRCSFGEIDIISLKDGFLVFTEVKTRSSNKFGLPEEAVTPFKLKKIYKVGEYYMKINTKYGKKARVEVVALDLLGKKVINARLLKV